MNQQASITALMSAYARAYHAENDPSPIFADSLARQLMSNQEYADMGSYILSGADFLAPDKKDSFAGHREALTYLVHTQFAPIPLARARFCEDSLRTAFRTGTEQYVIMGAGLDTFAFRERELVQTHPVFEVDHPLTQFAKRKRVERAGWPMPENLHLVPVDFAKDSLSSALLDAGFDPNKKTFFSWLGVSYYLTGAQITAVLSELSGLCAKGSSLVFDYGDEELFTSPVRRVKNMLAMAAAGGEPMCSCFDGETLVRLLESCGFQVYEWLHPQDIQEQYFTGRNMSAFEHVHYVNTVRQ